MLASITLPFTHPVFIFALVILIILIFPIILNKLRTPGIIGLIIAGVIIGPHGFHLLDKSAEIDIFGTIGLIYLMFLVGLEIDLNDMKRNRNSSLIFGALTFLFPVIGGGVAAYYLFDQNLIASLLIASMMATHTLVSYPIASRLGITKNKAIIVTIVGTIIVDTIVLVFLAVISSSVQGEITLAFWLKLTGSILLFGFIILWGVPKISLWFFKNMGSEGESQYVYVLSIVFVSAVFAEIVGIEPILGAFLAGLALNRLIPHSSALMNRIEFIGNAIFIPFFLISVGMLVDIKTLFTDLYTLTLSLSLIAVALFTKYLAAFVTQKILKYTVIERNLIFGLSTSRAAATIAVILVGYRLELVGIEVVNATVFLILVTSFVGSMVTSIAGRKQALIEAEEAPKDIEVSDKILVPIANPNTINRLIDFAILIKNSKSHQPIYPLSIVQDDHNAEDTIQRNKKLLSQAVNHASASDTVAELHIRVAVNTPLGIARTISELSITKVVMGWNGVISKSNYFFGTLVENLLQHTRQMIMVVKTLNSCNTFNRIVVVVPANAELEIGFNSWIQTIKVLANQIGASIKFFGETETLAEIKKLINSQKPKVVTNYDKFNDWHDFLIFTREIKIHDLLVVISARKSTVSYNNNLETIPKYLSKYFIKENFVIIFPEQNLNDNEVILHS